MGALSKDQSSCFLFCCTTCRVRKGAPSLSGAHLIIQSIQNTLSSLDRRAGDTGGFRYPCSDSVLRPCSTTQTHTVVPSTCLYSPWAQIIKTTSNSLWVSSLGYHQVGLSGLQYHAVLLGGEKQGAGLGQHAAGVCVEGGGRARCWCGAIGRRRVEAEEHHVLFCFRFECFSPRPITALPLTAPCWRPQPITNRWMQTLRRCCRRHIQVNPSPKWGEISLMICWQPEQNEGKPDAAGEEGKEQGGREGGKD